MNPEERRAYKREWYRQHREQEQARIRRYQKAHRQQVVDKQREWQAIHREELYEQKCQLRAEKARMFRAQRAAWLDAHPGAREAHRIVRDAIKAGQLHPPSTCSHCKRPVRVQAHHEDYTKPLAVIWLCAGCHRNLHNGHL